MNKLLLLIICSFLYSIAYSQTVIPGGTVSGTWTVSGSPYLVQGNLLIPNGTSLTINPGVTVSFQGNYKLLVSGRLVAAGTAADSIRFTAANAATGWQGIRFDNTASSNDSSKIAYCSIKYGYVLNLNGGGIYVNNFSKITITRNSITNCTADQGFGGAIFLNGSTAFISNNNLSYNHAIAGALFITNGSPVISNNIISFNDNVLPFNGAPGGDPDAYGAGISCYNADATIINNTIINNNSGSRGGGIVSNSSSSIIKDNNISNNHSDIDGGGIYSSGSVSLINNTISNNSAGNNGGGVYCEAAANSLFDKNIIINNTALYCGGGFVNYGTGATITNNLISNNSLSAPGAAFQGGGALWFVNSDATTIVSNNVICNNSSATNGGAIVCYSASPKLENNTISNNSAEKGGAVYCFNSNPSLFNMLLWGNTATANGSQVYLYDDVSDPAITYSDIQGGDAAIATNGNFYTGLYQNNINANPQFTSASAGGGAGFNGAAANWAPQNTSPAINTGQPGDSYPATDYAGNIRTVSGVIDMGAIENQTGIPPTAIVSGGGQACMGAIKPAVLFTFTYGTFPFTLQYSINNVPQTPVIGINSLQYIIQNPGVGVYKIVSVSDPVSVGTGSGSATVTVVTPVAHVNVNDSSQCFQGNNFAFTNTSSTNTGTMSYTWNFGDSSPTDTNTNVIHHYTNPGTYNVKLKVLGAAGCSDSVIQKITVLAFSINPLADTVKTFLDSVILNAGTGYNSYKWNTGATSQSIAVKQSGWYMVTVTNSAGCTAKDSSYLNFRKNKTLFIDKKPGICSSPFELSVRSKNMTNVIGLQGTISWDTSLVTYSSIIYESVAINITDADLNLNNAAKGYLTYSWSDNSLTGKSTADSTKLFTIRFDKKNIINAVTMPVTFSSLHTALEIDSINLSTSTPVIVTETAYINGAAGFTASPATIDTSLGNCDSVVYNSKVYYSNTHFTDTLKYFQSQCDSLYKSVNITIYTTVTPTASITANHNDILHGTMVSFSGNTSFGGSSPLLQWYKNGTAVPGKTAIVYSDSTLNAGDVIKLKLRSSFSCAVSDSVFSNNIAMQVNYLVSGAIKHKSGVVVPNVIVNTTGYSISNAKTDASGNYRDTLPGGSGHNYVVKPNKNNDVNKTNGVSTLDVAIIQSHILNSVLFNSPYQWIAADVNSSSSVTSIDIIYLKRLILGLDNTFPGNKLWTFIDTSAANFNPQFPLSFKNSFNFTNLLSDQLNKNFIGVKLGDVNFDWNPLLLKPMPPATMPVNFYYNDVVSQNETEIRVPIRVKNFKNILGIQFTLNFDGTVLQLKNIENNRLNLQYATNHSNEGKVPFIWNDDNNKLASLNDDDVLMDLVFTKGATFKEEDITVTSDITDIEAWDGSYQKHSIIKSGGKIIQKQLPVFTFTKESWQVTPNPTHGEVQLNIRLLQDKHINIQMMDAAGKTVLAQSNLIPKGASSIPIKMERDRKLSAGVYYIKLTGIEDAGIKKIILVR